MTSRSDPVAGLQVWAVSRQVPEQTTPESFQGFRLALDGHRHPHGEEGAGLVGREGQSTEDMALEAAEGGSHQPCGCQSQAGEEDWVPLTLPLQTHS